MLRHLLPARLFWVVFLANGLWGGVALAQSAPEATSGAAVTVESRTELEKETFSLVNGYRTSQALPPLQWDDSIARVARGHSRDMAVGDVDFGHDGFGDRVRELKTLLIGLNGAGENVLRTDDPNLVAERAVAAWLKSPHHLKNIRGDFNTSGLGIWRDDKGMIYFTQIFVKIVPPAKTTDNPPPGITTPFGLLARPTTR